MLKAPGFLHTTSAVAHYDRMLREYTPRAAFGITVMYLIRKHPELSVLEAERVVRTALDARPEFLVASRTFPSSSMFFGASNTGRK